MVARPPPRSNHIVAEAMTRVLNAEREAREKIEASKHEAAAIRETARATARRIESRAGARIVRASAHCEEATRKAEQQVLSTTEDLAPLTNETLIERAVAAVAAKLTGGPSES